MSQDLLIPFIPNINHTRPMSRESLTVNRLEKRPIAKRDEEYRSDAEQMETLTYLDALKQKMRDAHQQQDEREERQSSEEHADHGSKRGQAPLKTTVLARAVARAVGIVADPVGELKPGPQATALPDAAPRPPVKHLDLFV